MMTGLIIILLMVFVLPFSIKAVEENLEAFLFVMGISACLIAGIMSKELAIEALEEPIMIALAVLIAGALFHLLKNQFALFMNKVYTNFSLPVVVFFTVALLGLLSSVITAIVASIILVEIIALLPVARKQKIVICIIACFSIGFGAVLTPLGEPLATIAVSKMNADFFYLFNLLGKFVIPLVMIMAVLGAFYISISTGRTTFAGPFSALTNSNDAKNEIAATEFDEYVLPPMEERTTLDLIKQDSEAIANAAVLEQINQTNIKDLCEWLEKDSQTRAAERVIHLIEQEAQNTQIVADFESIVSKDKSSEMEDEGWKGIFMRAGKVYLFVMALVFLGSGFAPLIDRYVLSLDYHYLYWINMISAVLDNATLTAAELSPQMSQIQVEMILMGLLVSGGMLIPGNIPNIISASKLKITSKEWAVIGLPLGLILMVAMYGVLVYI